MTNLFMGDLSTWFQDFFWLIIIGGLILVVILIYFIYRQAPKKMTQTPIEDEQINAFIECYGGIENIQKAELDGRRMKCRLNDVGKVDIETLKTLGASGIFITGNQIKMVLPYDMQKLVHFIESKNMEGKE